MSTQEQTTKITLPLIAEFPNAATIEEARRTLDNFREATQPSSEYGITLFEPEPPLTAFPSLRWTKPLTPCGPDHDPKLKLLGTIEIAGIAFHAEAYQVNDNDQGCQQGLQNETETYLSEILDIVQGAAQTIEIEDRNYVLAITPYPH